MTGLKNYLIHHGEDDLNDFIRSESGKVCLPLSPSIHDVFFSSIVVQYQLREADS